MILNKLKHQTVLAGLSKSTTAPLQRVQNAAACLILGLQARDDVTPAHRQLHWLPVHQRIQHQLCTMMQVLCSSWNVPGVPRRQSSPSPTTRHDLICALPTARCTGYRDVVRPWASVPAPTHTEHSVCRVRSAMSLRDIADRTRFRKLLKTHFFDLGL